MDEVLIEDGSGLKVTHSSSLTLSFPKRTFQIQNTLCVPAINKKLISVHHFTKHNNVFLEFHPTCFLVKDQRTCETLLQGSCENGVYPLPHLSASTPITMVHECTSVNGWHQHLGHPFSKVVAKQINSFSLPVSSNSFGSHVCDSCFINKSHRLPFHKHGLTRQPSSFSAGLHRTSRRDLPPLLKSKHYSSHTTCLGNHANSCCISKDPYHDY